MVFLQWQLMVSKMIGLSYSSENTIAMMLMPLQDMPLLARLFCSATMSLFNWSTSVILINLTDHLPRSPPLLQEVVVSILMVISYQIGWAGVWYWGTHL